MRLIIGGAYQGKGAFAVNKYGLSADEICNGNVISADGKYSCVRDFQLFVRSIIECGKNPLDETEKLIIENPNIIIIMNEIGNGIVPLDKSERIWREQVGRVGCFLAANAESVERVVCGISTRIK